MIYIHQHDGAYLFLAFATANKSAIAAETSQNRRYVDTDFEYHAEVAIRTMLQTFKLSGSDVLGLRNFLP
jgi:hypothetical protein